MSPWQKGVFQLMNEDYFIEPVSSSPREEGAAQPHRIYRRQVPEGRAEQGRSPPAPREPCGVPGTVPSSVPPGTPWGWTPGLWAHPLPPALLQAGGMWRQSFCFHFHQNFDFDLPGCWTLGVELGGCPGSSQCGQRACGSFPVPCRWVGSTPKSNISSAEEFSAFPEAHGHFAP